MEQESAKSTKFSASMQLLEMTDSIHTTPVVPKVITFIKSKLIQNQKKKTKKKNLKNKKEPNFRTQKNKPFTFQ